MLVGAEDDDGAEGLLLLGVAAIERAKALEFVDEPAAAEGGSLPGLDSLLVEPGDCEDEARGTGRLGAMDPTS